MLQTNFTTLLITLLSFFSAQTLFADALVNEKIYDKNTNFDLETLLAEHFIIDFIDYDSDYVDKLLISASEDALEDQFEVGRDFIKDDIKTGLAQIWCNAFDDMLCVNNEKIINNRANFYVSLSIPETKNYTLSLSNKADYGTLYILRNGIIIHNLSESDFNFRASKGTENSYTMAIIYNRFATDILPTLESNISVSVNNSIITITASQDIQLNTAYLSSLSGVTNDYALSGSTAQIEANVAPGIYIINVVSNTEKYSAKILIK